ncbi:hypothetical protein VTN00DRAFT_4975 [Thermoascus crustaceus]|uniref:uncharacterized protein n=1 Tax=Thermoascus crustaceus TaxID=5088 RepID=UPI003744B014
MILTKRTDLHVGKAKTSLRSSFFFLLRLTPELPSMCRNYTILERSVRSQELKSLVPFPVEASFRVAPCELTKQYLIFHFHFTLGGNLYSDPLDSSTGV